MSSSSPPENPTPASSSSGSASPDFESTEDDVGAQEVSSEPKPGPSVVYSPQPLSSYHPHQPHLSPQPISSSQHNLDDSNISLDMDPETKHFIQSQGITIAEYIAQRRALAHYERPETPNIYSKVDEETANVIHSEELSISDLKRQEQALDYFNRMKEDPAGISRIESQIQERDSQANALGSYLDPNEELDPNDPFFDEVDDLVDPVLDKIKACFGSDFDSTPASTSRVSAEGKTLIFKGPKPQAVKDTDDADSALVGMSPGKVPEDTKSKISEGQPAPEMDTGARKRRMTNPSPEAMENKQCKQEKLLDSPPKHGKCLLPFTDNENDDDYETLRRVYWYILNQRTPIFQRGAFVPDFEIGVTDYFNQFLDSKITTEQCKKKVMELREKYLYFMELNGNEDFNEDDFYVPREYKMFLMFKIVWGADPGRGGSGSVADQGVDVDPIPAALTNVSGAGEAPEPAKAKSGPDRELDADMASAVSISLKEIRDDTMLQGAISGKAPEPAKVKSGRDRESDTMLQGENIDGGTMNAANVADTRASADQKHHNRDTDSTNPEHKARDETKGFQ